MVRFQREVLKRAQRASVGCVRIQNWADCWYFGLEPWWDDPSKWPDRLFVADRDLWVYRAAGYKSRVLQKTYHGEDQKGFHEWRECPEIFWVFVRKIARKR